MDPRQTGMLVMAISVAVLAASAVTWAACRWWFGKQLLAAAGRLQKSEKGRLFSQQQTDQARQQIGMLKAEIESHQHTAAETEAAARRRAAKAEEALRASERAAEASHGAVMLPLVAAHGFADTQILPE